MRRRLGCALSSRPLTPQGLLCPWSSRIGGWVFSRPRRRQVCIASDSCPCVIGLGCWGGPVPSTAVPARGRQSACTYHSRTEQAYEHGGGATRTYTDSR